MGFKTFGMAVLAAVITISTPAVAQEVEREGVIISRSAAGLAIRTREGPVTVATTPATTVRETHGVGGLGRRDRTLQNLMPGLIIKARGTLAGQTLTAESITFSERDWRSAVAARGGTMEEMGQLRQAIIDGNEYVVREEVVVLFASGSATVTAAYQQQLRRLAQAAAGHGNYRVSIQGFADPRGNAAANEALSQRRATAVRNFLNQTGSIQPGRVLSPAAMGEGTLAPGETAPTTEAQMRRVVVRIVTPKTQLTN